MPEADGMMDMQLDLPLFESTLDADAPVSMPLVWCILLLSALAECLPLHCRDWSSTSAQQAVSNSYVCWGEQQGSDVFMVRGTCEEGLEGEESGGLNFFNLDLFCILINNVHSFCCAQLGSDVFMVRGTREEGLEPEESGLLREALLTDGRGPARRHQLPPDPAPFHLCVFILLCLGDCVAVSSLQVQ